jgi:hypothetical protein
MELRRHIPEDRDLHINENKTKLHNGKIHNLYSSPNIIRKITPKRTGWVGHIARMGETRNA